MKRKRKKQQEGRVVTMVRTSTRRSSLGWDLRGGDGEGGKGEEGRRGRVRTRCISLFGESADAGCLLTRLLAI